MGNLLDKFQLFWGRNSQAHVRLIIINIAFSASVGIMYFITRGNINFVMVPDNFIDLLKQPFSLLTYMFAHNSLWHLIGNLILIYFVGRVFEDLLGAKKTYTLYFLSGAFGAIAFTSIVSGNAFLIGASGAAMGLLYGLTVLQPNYEFFLYGLIKLKLWWITAVYLVMDLAFVLVNHNTAGGQICHLFGGATGALLVAYWTGKIHFGLPVRQKKRKESYPFTVNKNTSPRSRRDNKPSIGSVPTQEEIDFILDKINERGYNNLTQQEKETLFRAKDIEV